MNFSDKLQLLRKNRGLTQEELAEKLAVSRQAVAKWETGQGYPDIDNLVWLSDFFHVTVDYLVKNEDCTVALDSKKFTDIEELINFRLEASRNTYAGGALNQCNSTRPDSIDFRYEKNGYIYHDTYVGSEQFAGEEAVWKDGKAIYVMNYTGRVTDEHFSGNFLKEALCAATLEYPYRGPRCYKAGDFIYTAKVSGDIEWFQGYEEIYYGNSKVYECYFHGGLLK
mgnify:CR=1 FL=1